MTQRLQYIRIAVRRTTSTFLPCAACGGFRTEFEIVADPNESTVGVHRACLGSLKVKRQRRAKALPEAAE